jgi:hypothetical protein
MKRAVKLGVAFVLFFGLLGFPQTADEILKRVEEQGFFGTGRGLPLRRPFRGDPGERATQGGLRL